MRSLNRAEKKSNYAPRGGPEHAPRAAVKRLYCSEHGMQDARKIGRAAEFTLACGCSRTLLTSEKIQERNDNA
jgi:hypothetical protein